jgi:hypothetical protein
MSQSEREIRRHLLGLSSQAEREEAADRMLTDENAFETVIAEEQQLIDDYLAGVLTNDERIAFEEQCKLSIELSGRLAVAKSLTFLTQAAADHDLVASASRIPIQQLEGKRQWFRRALPVWAAVAAMLIVTAGLTAYLSTKISAERRSASISEQSWLVRDDEQRRRIETLSLELRNAQSRNAPISPAGTAENPLSEEYWKKRDEEQRRRIDELSAELKSAEQKAATADRPAPQLLSLLIPPEMRGADQPPNLTVPSDTGLVELQFSLDVSKKYPSFSVKITAARRPVLDQHGLRAKTAGQRWVVPVYVPVELLGAGRYDAVLYGVADGQDEPLYDYHFQLSR